MKIDTSLEELQIDPTPPSPQDYHTMETSSKETLEAKITGQLPDRWTKAKVKLAVDSKAAYQSIQHENKDQLQSDLQTTHADKSKEQLQNIVDAINKGDIKLADSGITLDGDTWAVKFATTIETNLMIRQRSSVLKCRSWRVT